jgi:hypothetical protein
MATLSALAVARRQANHRLLFDRINRVWQDLSRPGGAPYVESERRADKAYPRAARG